MIEIEDLKKVKLEEDDLLVFQINHDTFFTPPNYVRKHLKIFFKDLRKIFKNKFIVIPSTIKLGIIKESDFDNVSDIKVNEVKPILFNSNNLSKE